MDKNSNLESPARYENLEALIDELLKDKPNEMKVRSHMKMAGLSYTTDSVQRMTLVLAEMELLKDACRSARAPQSRSPKSSRNDQSAN